MKIKILTTLAAAAALAAMGDTTTERENHLAMRRAAVSRRMSSEGGYVERITDGGRVNIVNAQSVVNEAVLEAAATSIRRILLLAVDITKGESDNAYRPGGRYPVVISLTDTIGDATLMVAPEQCWAVVNTKLLSSDSPTESVLADRAQKEIWRALAIILGASNSSIQPCVMHQVNSLGDLDAIRTKVPCPEPFTMMGMVANHLGIGRVMKASYRRACEEGWAPAPTNDVQKAIWDQVHAVPKNPMKIEFDPKKGK